MVANYKWKKIDTIFGINRYYFFAFAAVVIIASQFGWLNGLMVGAVAYCIATSGIFSWLGDSLPFVRDVGGNLLMPLIGLVVVKQLGWIPEGTLETVNSFVNSGYQDFYIAAILVGSILSMNRKLLVASVLRYLPVILISQIVAIAFLALSAILTGTDIISAIFYVGLPCMAGGSNGAMVILPSIYSDALGKDMSSLVGGMYSVAVFGNYFALLIVILMRILAEKFPRLMGNGHGDLLRVASPAIQKSIEEDVPLKKSSADYRKLGGGLFICLALMVLGNIAASFIPGIVQLAWTIIFAVIFKATGLIPDELCEAANFWYQCMLINGLLILTAALSICKVSLDGIFEVANFSTVFIIFMGILGAVVGAQIACQIFGLHRYEGSLTAAMCSCNIGGTGDLQMMAASNRMELLPFASISTRLGGGLMTIIAGILFPIFARLAGLL